MSDRDETDDRALLPVEQDGAHLIRRQWHNGQWFFSVIDVIRALTDSPTPRRYWAELKHKLQDEVSEVFAQSEQLKMRAPDGKMRATDAANAETMLRIVQSIPSPKAEPVKQWLAQVGTERLEEIEPQRKRRPSCHRHRYTLSWDRQAGHGCAPDVDLFGLGVARDDHLGFPVAQQGHGPATVHLHALQ